MDSFREIVTPQAYRFFTAALWGLMKLTGAITVSRLILASDLGGPYTSGFESINQRNLGI